MHLIDFPIPNFVLISSSVVSIAALSFAIFSAPWKALINVQQRQHLFFAAMIGMVMLWSMKITWVKGFLLHPMGITAVTVIFGWRLTMVMGFLALLAFELLHHGNWRTLPVDYLFTVLLPATVTWFLIRLVHGLKSRNLFLFMLGVGFAGAILGFLINIGLIVLLALIVGHQDFIHRLGQEFPIIVMLLNMEGFLNGAVVTAMSVFAPELVKSFDDRKYLG